MSTWGDEAIALNARRFGENDAILQVFAKHQGKASGLVYGGAGKRKRHLLEPGTRLDLTWKARTDDHLGFFDPIEASGGGPAALMDDPAALLALSSAAALLQVCTPERAVFSGLYDATLILFDALAEADTWPALYIRWEVGLLAELGFGLDFSECALTGTRDNLTWISPRTGRAASAEAGAPFEGKLLALPAFLLGAQNRPLSGDVADGFALTGHFITRELLEPLRQDMPEPRARLIYALGRSGRL